MPRPSHRGCGVVSVRRGCGCAVMDTNSSRCLQLVHAWHSWAPQPCWQCLWENVFKKGKTLHGNEEGGKNCDEQPCAIMVKEGGGKEVLQVLEHFAACREPLGSRWIFPEGLYLLESPHGSSYFWRSAAPRKDSHCNRKSVRSKDWQRGAVLDWLRPQLPIPHFSVQLED